jgi:lipopolysaccharide biosynthesis protein
MKPRRFCLFAHYDADSEVKSYIIKHLESLRSICTRIIFLTSSEKADRVRDSVARFVDDFRAVENKGYDFGMWQQGILGLKPGSYDELVLTNSSIIGPITPLERCFDTINNLPIDIWSMTDNHEFLWHMQSYFLVFRKRVIESRSFHEFWNNLIPYKDKWQTILSYELGLSTYFNEAGFFLRALYRSHEIQIFGKTGKTAERIRKTNPTVAMPLELLDNQFPYVKIELLNSNPYKVDLKMVHQRLHDAGFDARITGQLKYRSPPRDINYG